MRHRLEQDPARMALGPGAVLHAITDRIVDTYITMAVLCSVLVVAFRRIKWL